MTIIINNFWLLKLIVNQIFSCYDSSFQIFSTLKKCKKVSHLLIDIQKSCSTSSPSLFFFYFFSLLLALFYNTLSTRCSNQNQLRTSGSFFSLTIVLCMSQIKLFLILSSFTILPYILILVIRIVWLYQCSFRLIIFSFIMMVIIIIIFMMNIIIIIMIIIKKISKTHFVTRSGTIMWKREKKNMKILANKMKIYIIIRMVTVIWVVLVVCQSISQIMRRT